MSAFPCRPLAAPVAAALWLLPLLVSAHEPRNSRLMLRTDDAGQVELRWDVALADADLAVGLDATAHGAGNGNGAVEPAEAAAGESALFAYAAEHLHLAGDARCVLAPRRPMQLAQRDSGRSLVLRFTADCPAREALALRSTLLQDADPGHRSLLRAEWRPQGVVQSAVLSAAQDSFTLRRSHSAARTLGQYAGEGIRHVLEGWDHLLFLLGLFLPAALRWREGRWQPADSPWRALRQAAGVVSAFTLAHAATLCLAAIGVLALPSRLVESAVAATVLFTGLHNLRPVVTRRLWLLAAVFGLVHGSAMAGALLELGLPVQGRVWALLGFNLGVEAAQLALVLLALPLLLALRHWPGYVRGLLWPGSLLVALAGALWLLDRALALYWPLPI